MPSAECSDESRFYTDEFTEKDWKKFEDPELYKNFRHDLEQDMNVSLFSVSSVPNS